MRIKTYVINLKDSVDRRNDVLAELSRYPFMDPEVIEAVDGRKMSSKEVETQFDCRKFKYKWEREVKPGEIGCTLSHRKCYRKLLESEEEVVLIVEDDVYFLAEEKTVNDIVKKMIGRMPDKPCLVTFTRHSVYYSESEFRMGKYSFCRVREAWGTCAYLINRKAAKLLLQKKQPYTVADDYLDMDEKGIEIIGIYPMLAIGKSEMGDIASLVIEVDGRDLIPKIKLPIHIRIQNFLSQKYNSFLYRIGIKHQISTQLRKDSMKIMNIRTS